MLRILFINRMASMERGGGETFDLEIARHLARMGHQVTFLSGIPVFGRARLPIGRACGGKGVSGYGGAEDGSSPTPILPHSHTPIRTHTLRAPMFPWFPWDRVKGGWRVRVAEFWLFEKLAAHWVWKHRHEFDVIQVCELPMLVATVKQLSVKGDWLRGGEAGKRFRANYEKHERHEKSGVGVYGSDGSEVLNTDSGSALREGTNNQEPITNNLPPIIIRLTAPNYYDPAGGVAMADGVIASGTSLARLRKKGLTQAQDIPNGVDLDLFSPAFEGSRPSALVFLYVARFQAFKKHDILIRAFASLVRELPQARLCLAGSGPLKKEVERLVTELKLSDHIELLGEVPYSELPGVYASSDIKVISSDYESFCFAAIEAMAVGLPVVTTDCGWVPRLIGDKLLPIEKQWTDGDQPDSPSGRFERETQGARIRVAPGGLVTGRNDPASLAAALLRLAGSIEMRKTMGEWNRNKAQREHGWLASAEKLVEFYKAIMSAKS